MVTTFQILQATVPLDSKGEGLSLAIAANGATVTA